jgi:hypothetical protein
MQTTEVAVTHYQDMIAIDQLVGECGNNLIYRT